jgi:hypothetical protein
MVLASLSPSIVTVNFTFVDQIGVAIDDPMTSAPVYPSDHHLQVSIEVSGTGTYSINGGEETTSPGLLNPGDYFQAHHTASSNYATNVDTTVTLAGSVSDTFTSRTINDDTSYLFFDDFETGGFTTQNGIRMWNEAWATVSDEKPQSGTYSVKLPYDRNAWGADTWCELGVELNDYYPEIWVQFDSFIPANYWHPITDPSNNKGPVTAWERDFATQSRGESYVLPQGVGLVPNPYDTGSQGGSKLTFTFWREDPVGGGTFKHGNAHDIEGPSSPWTYYYGLVDPADYGQWVTFTTHYKYSTIANNDGVMELWKYNHNTNVSKKVVDVQTANWYTEDLPYRGFTDLRIWGYFNASPVGTPDRLGPFYLDNFKFNGATPIDIPG